MVYPVGKGPFEALTTIDERVDFVHNQVSSVQSAISQLLEKEGLPSMETITREVRLAFTVVHETGIRVWEQSPLTGRITQITRHWPDGADALVDVAFGHGDVWVMPKNVDTFVALNDATPVINVHEPVHKGEELWMILRNRDLVNDHSITIVVTIEGVE